MTENHHKWHSGIIGREFELLVFGHAGYPLLLFPTSMGKYYENKDFGLIEAVRPWIESGKIRIYCPDSLDRDSWYNKHIHPRDRVLNHILYENLIMQEIVPRMQHESQQARIAVAGCSFGGYHALNLAFRHPDLVSCVFSMGGAFDIKNQLDGYYDDQVFFNNPPDYLPNLHHPDLWKMGIVLGSSEYDFCLPQNVEMHRMLQAKNIASWLDIRPGYHHDWPVWQQMFPEYVGLIKQEH